MPSFIYLTRTRVSNLTFEIQERYIYRYLPPCYRLQEHQFQTETSLPDNILHLRKETLIIQTRQYSSNPITPIQNPIPNTALKLVVSIQVLQGHILATRKNEEGLCLPGEMLS